MLNIKTKTFTLLLGATAGQGVATVGSFLTEALAKLKYNFITYQGYHSRVRGGHNTYSLKISAADFIGPSDMVDMVLSLNEAADLIDSKNLKQDGLFFTFNKNYENKNFKCLNVPYKEIGASNKENFVALGVLSVFFKIKENNLISLIEDKFKDKAADFVKAYKQGYQWAEKNVTVFFDFESGEIKENNNSILISGNQALALGAALAGIKFCSFYPMTPGSGVAITLAAWAKEGILVEQAEDEIAAINMAIGASYAGAPSLVATSGGGFALMCEGVSLAAMTETPIVIVVGQRPGPATGLPTRTEQADLNLVLYAGHGEFPKAIFAPADVQQAYQLAARAVYLAEQSQGPVFILSDQFLSDSVQKLNMGLAKLEVPFTNPLKKHEENLSSVKDVYCRYKIVEKAEAGCCGHKIAEKAEDNCCGHKIVEEAEAGCCGHKIAEKAEDNCCDYKIAEEAEAGCCGHKIAEKAEDNCCGHKIVEEGLSPRLLPGFSEFLVKVDSDEHDEEGHITEDLDIRIKMQNKRLKKMDYLKENMLEPFFWGDPKAETLFVSWGSSKAAVWEACQTLKSEIKIAFLHFNQIFPLNTKMLELIGQKLKNIIVVESNSTGQMAALIRQETLLKTKNILRYDGLPLTGEYIVNKYRQEHHG